MVVIMPKIAKTTTTEKKTIKTKSSVKKSYYLTTAIAYTNGNPHIGHAYEFTIADSIARANKMLDKDVFFLTGTDEHGQKIQKSANDAKKDVMQFVTEIADSFKKLCKDLDVDYSRFIRTTDEDHIKVVNTIVQKVFDSSDIYKGKYSGNYCIYDEAYYPDSQLIESKLCPECKRETKLIEEDAYFFKLGKYQEKIIELIENDVYKILPIERKNEIIARLKNDILKDLCITRRTAVMSWGIDFPIDKNFVIYVWFDALINYITGAGYNTKEFEKIWPCDCHFIGKDISWFHAVIWPAILLSAEIELPKTLLVHGFVNDKIGDKMSKSKGNGIDTYEIINKYSSDVFRFYILKTTPIGNDLKFNEEELVEHYNNELANSLGNLISRAHTLVSTNLNGSYEAIENINEIEQLFDIKETRKKIKELIDSYKLKEYIDFTFTLIAKINKYINDKKPWNKSLNDDERKKIIYNILDHIRLVTILLKPMLPNNYEKIKNQLGLNNCETIKDFDSGKLFSSKIENEKIILFPKIELNKKILPIRLINGKIISVNDHPEADKLYILKVDVGNEKIKQLVAGLKSHFKKDELLNKKIIVVDNLKHAKLRGIMSEGMVLCVEDTYGKIVELLRSEDESVGKHASIHSFTLSDKEIKIQDFAKFKLSVMDKKLHYNGEVLLINGKPIVSDSIVNSDSVR